MDVKGEIVYGIDQWLLLAMLLVALLVAEEFGFRIGRRRRADYDDDGRSNFGNLQAGLFGLMGLLLAFTFAMAQQRFETRKDTVILDANAIGTAWLRTAFLPEPARGEVRALFVRYVEIRTDLKAFAPDRVSDTHSQIDQLQGEIRSHDAPATNAAPTPATALLAAATNEMIDMHAKRVAAARNHVPEIVVLMVSIFALAAAAVTGYRCGIGLHRYRLPNAAFLVLIVLVIGVIIDLDRPQRGLITVDQAPMLDLRAGIVRP